MKNTRIEWTGTPIPGTDIVAPGYTFNPWIGCTNAEAEDKRRGWTPDGWGKGKPRKRTSVAYWRQPERWNERLHWCYDCGEFVDAPDGICRCTGLTSPSLTPNVFCGSLCDILDPEVPIQQLADALDVIRRTTHLRWLLLTKRPELFPGTINSLVERQEWEDEDNASEFGFWLHAWNCGNPPDNVAIGTSVEDQQRADERIPALLRIPARYRFLSLEPLLGPVDLREWLPHHRNCTCGTCYGRAFRRDQIDASLLDWIIIGGESGPQARPCTVEWVRSLVRQGKDAGTKVFVKQLGAHVVDPNCVSAAVLPSDTWWPSGVECIECDRRMVLRHPKGGDTAEWPEDLRVREYLS